MFVVISTWYALGFVIVCATSVSYGFRCLWVGNFVGLGVECKCVVGR